MIAVKSQVIKRLEDPCSGIGAYSGKGLGHGTEFNQAMTSADLLLKKVTLLIMWKIECQLLGRK